MGLFQVVLDWFLMVLTLLGETFYLHKIVKEEHSVLMDMMKYLILNDVIFMPIILIHDIPSYFMEQPLSDKIFMVKEVEILAQCLPFFYALLMLPIFALLNLIAIVAVYIFVAFKKRHISQIAITICYILSVGMSIPLMTDCCGYNFNNVKHYWYYDYEKPYTALYQRFNGTLQIVTFGIVGVCMTIVLIYLSKRPRAYVNTPSSAGRPSTNGIHPSPQTESTRVTHAAQVNQVTEGNEPKSRGMAPRSRSVLDQAFAFLILCICFIIGTICFNFVHCDGNACLIFTVVTSYVNRAKWLIYCFLMRRQATISRLFRN